MIKPKWGFAHENGTVKFPPGWDTGDRKQQLLTRRAFFEVTLISWIIRHNLIGDEECSIMKTIHQKGKGYDRPSKHDEIKFDLRLY